MNHDPVLPGFVLGIFAKEPRAGQVKTRLAQATSAEWAARVAEAFLRDTLARLASLPAQRYLVFSPFSAEAFFASLAGDRFQLLPQGEGDLGTRLERFFQARFQEGAQRVVVIGSDSPTLPLGYIEEAFALLQRADVVLGPASDGGYYLVGLARRLLPIFQAIPWGGANVLQATMARLTDPSWQLEILPPWYDVDTLDDWYMLQGHLAAWKRTGKGPALPHTEKLWHEGTFDSPQDSC